MQLRSNSWPTFFADFAICGFFQFRTYLHIQYHQYRLATGIATEPFWIDLDFLCGGGISLIFFFNGFAIEHIEPIIWRITALPIGAAFAALL